MRQASDGRDQPVGLPRNLIPALSPHYRVIVMDSRGHGRSTRDSQPYGYDLMASDVVGLMDYLKIKKADIVG
jgi:pimeloyl-ACP methyl ester carboxylesterase